MAKKQITIKFHQDPGHGWYAVKRTLLNEVGVQDQISSYSYQNGQTVYLEEDRDAGLFLEAAKAKGYEFKLKSGCQRDNNSPVRYYESFQA